jgi:hypothetical protein
VFLVCAVAFQLAQHLACWKYASRDSLLLNKWTSDNWPCSPAELSASIEKDKVIRLMKRLADTLLALSIGFVAVGTVFFILFVGINLSNKNEVSQSQETKIEALETKIDALSDKVDLLTEVLLKK